MLGKRAIDDVFSTKNRGGKTEYYYRDIQIDKSKYWVLRLKTHIRKRKDIYFHHRINPDYQIKMLILMKIWGLNSPSLLINRLIDEYYSLFRLRQTKDSLNEESKK